MGKRRITSGEYQLRGEYHRKIDPQWRYYPVYVEKMAYVRRYLDRTAVNKKICDLGCGEGVLIEEYRQKGFNIEGVDLNYSAEHITRGNITDLSYHDACFDLVLALDVIEHLDYQEQGKAFSEIFRVLKPGGRALLALPNLAHFASRLTFMLWGKLLRTSAIERHPGDRPIEEFLALLKGAGFKMIRRKGLFPTYPILAAMTYIYPEKVRFLHQVVNRIFSPPSLCFLNIIELQR
jgi:2-polyprenyl-3-methyl-5-hydroxy-6-metoxy-1,4-benzoquinol methylase